MAPVRRLGDRQWLLRPAKSVVLGSNPSDCRKAVIAQSVVRVNAFVDQFQLSYRVHFVAIANRPSMKWITVDGLKFEHGDAPLTLLVLWFPGA